MRLGSLALASLAASGALALTGWPADNALAGADTRPGPSVDVPAFSVLAVSLPTISVPAVSVPPVSVPTVSVPGISTPPLSTPVAVVPSVSTPGVTTPGVTTPPVDVPPTPTAGAPTPAPDLPPTTGVPQNNPAGGAAGAATAATLANGQPAPPSNAAAGAPNLVDPQGPATRVGPAGDDQPFSGTGTAGHIGANENPGADEHGIGTAAAGTNGGAGHLIGTLAFPASLVAAIAGYLVLQGRIDRREPKVHEAPVHRMADALRFQ